jgi:hypothetical protein
MKDIHPADRLRINHPNQSSYPDKAGSSSECDAETAQQLGRAEGFWTDFLKFREQLAYCYIRGEKRPSRLDSPMCRNCVEKEAQGDCEVAHSTYLRVLLYFMCNARLRISAPMIPPKTKGNAN